jgi:CubicO group peptidase (beta-lactamase class C family)
LIAKLVYPCLLGALILTAVPPAYAQRGNPRVEFEGQTIDAMVAAFMKDQRIPGMTLAIVQAPYVSRVVGYGVADVEKGLLASPKTLWNVGQTTQAYTAVAVLQLAEAGQLALDDPLASTWPACPPGGTVWAGCRDVPELAERHGVTDRAAVVESMREGLAAALRHATAPY